MHEREREGPPNGEWRTSRNTVRADVLQAPLVKQSVGLAPAKASHFVYRM
jgi:hypothetical protein